MKKINGTQNVSLKIFDSDGKTCSDNKLLLHGNMTLEDGQTLSLMSTVELLIPLERLFTSISVPCIVKGNMSLCEVKSSNLPGGKTGCALIVSTHGQDAEEVIKLHNKVYEMFFAKYRMVAGKPILVAKGWLAKTLVNFLNRLLPKQSIEILFKEEKPQQEETEEPC